MFLQILRGQLLGFHIFIAFLKLEREPFFFLMPEGITVEVYQFPSF